MNQVQKNNLIKIYYKTHKLQTGLPVVFTIINDNGVFLELNTPANTEIGTNGLYYLNFTTPNYDTYLLVKSGISGNIDEVPLVLRCGNPSENKLFYVEKRFQTGKTIPYNIFNITGTIIKQGNLNEDYLGFYHVNVDDLSNGTYFFRVDPDISKFTIPLSQEFVPGECVASTEIRYVTVNLHTSKGGASKLRPGIFDYQYEASKKKIHAKLIEEDNDKLKGVSASLIYDKDDDENILNFQPVSSDFYQIHDPKTGKELEKELKDINKDLIFYSGIK